MEKLLTATTGLQEDAMSLTYALKGDPKYQGDWGEKVLERALEDAGLDVVSLFLLEELINE